MVKPNSEQDKSQIRHIIEGIGQSFQSKDPDSFVKPFDEEVVALFTGAPMIRGKMNLRDYIARAVVNNVSIDYDEIIVSLSDLKESGYVIGSYKAVNKTPDGLAAHNSRFLASLSKIGGEWKMTAICYNRP